MNYKINPTQANYGRRVMARNVTSFSESNKLMATLESTESGKRIDTVLAKKLLDSIADLHVRVDFGPIKTSGGDIDKFKGTTNMLEVLELAKQTPRAEDARNVIEAINILQKHKKQFQQGYYFNATIITLTYESFVYACLDATSVIADDVVSSIRGDIGTQNGMNLRNSRLQHREHSLAKVNDIIKADKEGQLGKLFTTVLNDKTSKNLIGSGQMLLMLSVGVALSIVPVVREIVYVYYQSRVSVTDYLDHQKELIKLNETRLKDSGMSKGQVKKISSNQVKVADKIDRISDKIRIKHEAGVSKAKVEITKAEKSWTLSNIEDDITNGVINNDAISII